VAGTGVRLGAGACLLLLGLIGILKFEWLERALAGFSGDGVVMPATWHILRIMVIALWAPGLALLFIEYLRKPVQRLDTRLSSVSTPRFLFTTLGSAAVIRILWVMAAPLRLYADWATYDELGWRMAQTGALAEATHRTMYLPPGYPFLLSLVYRIFGHAPQAAVLINVALSVGIVYLAYRLARRIWGEQVGRWTAVLLVIFPSQILYVNLTCTEPLFTFLFLLALELFMAAEVRAGLNWHRFAATGVVLGLATLTRALTLTFPLVMAVALFSSVRSKRRAVVATLAVVLGLAVVVAPWFVRNYRLNGRATISTNGSMNFYIGNHPGATFGFSQPDPSEFAGFSPVDEARIDSLAWARGLDYIRARPLAFVARGVMKIGFLMSSDIDGWAYSIAREADSGEFGRHAAFGVLLQAWWYLFVLVTAVGVWSAVRSKLWQQPVALLYLGTLLYWLAVHFVFFGLGRFHYPIVPIMAAFAALALDRLDAVSPLRVRLPRRT